MTAVRVAADATEADGVRLWPLYDAVFGDQPDRATWLDTMWDRHRGREGFRFAVASEGDEPVGFAWGGTPAAPASGGPSSCGRRSPRRSRTHGCPSTGAS